MATADLIKKIHHQRTICICKAMTSFRKTRKKFAVAYDANIKEMLLLWDVNSFLSHISVYRKKTKQRWRRREFDKSRSVVVTKRADFQTDACAVIEIERMYFLSASSWGRVAGLKLTGHNGSFWMVLCFDFIPKHSSENCHNIRISASKSCKWAAHFLRRFI